MNLSRKNLMRSSMSIAVVLAALGGGCAAPGAPALPPAAAIVSPAGIPTGSIPRTAREPVEGLTLDRALELADAAHPGLEAARARIEAAGGRALQASRFPNPEVAARMESAPFEGGTSGDAEYLLGITQKIPVGGRLPAAARVEEIERERLERGRSALRLEIQGRVRGAFAAALYAERAVEAQEEAARIAENGAAIIAARREAGDAIAEDAARAEMERARARLERERARSLRGQALAALAAEIGDPAIAIASLEGNLEAALEMPALETLAARLADSSALAAAGADIRAWRARADLAATERIPDVSLDLFYRRLEGEERDAFDIGIRLPVPLFDRNPGRLAEARWETAAAEARARAARVDLERRLRESHAVLQRAIETARVLREEILPRARVILDGFEARHAAGDLSLAAVLPARRDWTALQLSRLEALRDVRRAWAELTAILPVP